MRRLHGPGGDRVSSLNCQHSAKGLVQSRRPELFTKLRVCTVQMSSGITEGSGKLGSNTQFHSWDEYRLLRIILRTLAFLPAVYLHFSCAVVLTLLVLSASY